MDNPKELICRDVIAKLIKNYGWAHTLSALEFHLGDSPMEKDPGPSKYQVLNEFGLSVLIEQLAMIEGVSHEIGWLVQIRADEMRELMERLNTQS